MEGGPMLVPLGVESWMEPAENPADRSTIATYDVDKETLERWRSALREYLSARAALLGAVEPQGVAGATSQRVRRRVFDHGPGPWPSVLLDVEHDQGRSIATARGSSATTARGRFASPLAVELTPFAWVPRSLGRVQRSPALLSGKLLVAGAHITTYITLAVTVVALALAGCAGDRDPTAGATAGTEPAATPARAAPVSEPTYAAVYADELDAIAAELDVDIDDRPRDTAAVSTGG
jgi:hypothetical protein